MIVHSMNPEITALEDACKILRTARLEVINSNPVAWLKLRHAADTIEKRLTVIVSE